MMENGTPGKRPAHNLDGEIAPDVLEAIRQLGATGRSSVSAAGDAAKALRSLVSADVSLARSAFGRTLAFTGVAIVLGAVAGLLLMTATVVLLARKFGLPWTVSLLIVGAVCLVFAGLAGWRAITYFEHTRMKATRRQLARLGIGELADYTPNAGDAISTKQVTEQAPPENAAGAPAKTEQGIEVTPP